jgi:ankyrin repeat protein
MAGTSILVMALVKYDNEIAERLLEAGTDPNYCNSTGYTPLYYTYNVNPQTVDLLLKFGAHPDGCQKKSCPNRHRTTPLLWFIDNWMPVKGPWCAKLLIHRGCDLNKRGMDSKTPLDAALGRHQELYVAQALVIYGCEISKSNFQTFIDIANSNSDIAEFCNTWLCNPPPLSHLCCTSIRKVLKFDFANKLSTFSPLDLPKPAIRSILMEDIYAQIRGPF